MTVGTPSFLIFGPDSQIITSITNANPGVVTTEEPHGYLEGIYVRIYMPGNFGMYQVANQVYLATILSPTIFSINVDTTNFDTFTTLSTQKCQSIPVGEVSQTLKNAEMNNLTPIGGPG